MNEAIPPDRDQSFTGAEQPLDEKSLHPDPEARSLLEKSPEDVQLPPALREHLRRLAADLARQAEKEHAEPRNGLPDSIVQLIGDLPEASSADVSQIDLLTGAATARPRTRKRSALWRVTFQINREDAEMLTVEVRRPLVIGRVDPRAATHPDLDLSAYGALELECVCKVR